MYANSPKSLLWVHNIQGTMIYVSCGLIPVLIKVKISRPAATVVSGYPKFLLNMV